MAKRTKRNDATAVDSPEAQRGLPVGISAPTRYTWIDAEGIRIDHLPGVGWRVTNKELRRYLDTMNEHERKIMSDLLSGHTTDCDGLYPHDVEDALYNMERIRNGKRSLWLD